MSVASNQLAEISQKLLDDFASHAVISVTATKGAPPDRFEITYTMTGLTKDDKGEIRKTTDLIVEISIPFGFPHFPPSCKPKSGIFHPDFDPAAICLGDFWHQNTTLADLVIYIGRLINGEIYSRKNAFNEEACLWYLDNQEKFPLTSIVWGNEREKPAAEAGTSHVDTLDEEDLLPDFNFFTLEKNFAEEGTSAEVSPAGSESYESHGIDHLFLLEGQKKFYQLLEVAGRVSLPPEDLQPLIEEAETQIARAEELHDKARRLEDRGEKEKALKTYAEVGATVSDFPALHTDVQRISEKLTSEKGKRKNPQGSDDSLQGSDRGRIATAKVDKERVFKSGRLRGSKTLLYFCLILFSIAAALGGCLWIFSHNKLAEAEQDYAACISSLENNQFAEAKRLCEQALQSIGKVKFIEQQRARLIESDVAKLLSSEKLNQGLAGNLLFHGTYLPAEQVKVRQLLEKQLRDANAVYLREKWQKAADLYAKIEIQAEKDGLLEPSAVKEIHNKRLIAEFRVAFDKALIAMALVAEQKGQWEIAIAELIKAQDILAGLPDSDRDLYSEQLQYALQKCRFEDLKSQGDQYYGDGAWHNAITSYNFALANAEDDSIIPADSLESIRRSISRAKVFITIDEGNRAYEAGNWDGAIEAYSRGIAQLAIQPGIFAPAEAEINRRKLERIVLKASIVRDRQAVDSYLEKSQLQNVRQGYQRILASIDASSFSRENEFAALKKEMAAALKDIDERIYIADKTAYLTNNYQRLFTANYPATAAENLINPVIKFTRETPTELVFKLQCTESGGSRPLTLVMFYAYNKKTGQWNFFSESN